MRNAAKSKPRTTRQAAKIALQPPAPTGTALLARPDPDVSLPEKMEGLLIGGNLGAMSVDQRVVYYNKLCKSLGLNPLTRPFEYLMLNGKMVLYALRACTEQLRKIHGVSVTKETRKIEDEHCIVDVEVMDRTGRTDTGTGVVWIGNLKGDNYANALMKASTKAKRRATLSIVGLGFLDESELDTMRGAFKRVTPAGRIMEDAEPDNKYLDAYHEREQKELSKLTKDQREVLERKMKGGDASWSASISSEKTTTTQALSSSGGSTEPANQATSAPIMQTEYVDPAKSRCGECGCSFGVHLMTCSKFVPKEGSGQKLNPTPCLFYRYFPESETYLIDGTQELKTANKDLLGPLWNGAQKAIIATPAQLGKLISQFEYKKVPFRELKNA